MSKKIKLSNITPDDKNNNKHTAYGMDLLEKSVNKVGIIESITVSNDDKIISGNARHEVIGKNFTKEAIVIETDGTQPIIIKRTDIESDTKQFYEASILANTTSKKNIDFDMEVIESLSEEYDIDIEDLGVDTIEDEHLEAEEDDFSGTPPKEPITVLGDLYEIGEHRLLCGDSTDSDSVAKLMNGEKADMVFTDPPYGIGYEYNSHKDTKGDNYLKFCDEWFANLQIVSDFIFISTGWAYQKYWWNKNPKDEMYWLSRNKQTGGTVFHFRRIEPLFIWGKPKHKYNFDFFEEITDREDGLRELHTCPKPIKLISSIIEGVDTGDLICDIFLGSGTTMVAAHQLNCKCYGMELDPKYCDVIVARMIKLDSTLPIKRNGVLLTNSEVLKFTENTSESN